MQIEVSKTNEENLRGKVKIALVFALLTFSAATNAWAVSGPCNLCHTMHNSQDGTAQVAVGPGAAWSNQTGGAITGGDSTAPIAQLLVSDCVGCHSLAGSANVTVNDGYNIIPIVYNTGGYPSTTLAGGNFALVPGDDTFGHNVRGIANDDAIHDIAPGMIVGVGCLSSCHTDLTLPDSATDPTPEEQNNKNGCRGCHINTRHHDPAVNGYRFLAGHGGVVKDVGGTPDSDWEATVSSSDHNVYLYDNPSDGVNLGPQVSMGRWCAGCHSQFHAWGQVDGMLGDEGGGDILATAGGNPWLRHPTNVMLPNDGEYAALDGEPYNPATPVAQRLAWDDNFVNTADGTSSDQVFCLSCHRAHASDQPDALRFDYATILSHQGSSLAITDQDNDGFPDGCFYCHSAKANL